MATYFHGSTSEINNSINNSSSSPSPHADGLQTLYLMNPNNYHAPYSDAPHHQTPPTPNMLLLNPTAPPPHALNLAHLSHAPTLPSPNQHQHQHLATILASANSQEHSRPSLFGPHEITAAFHSFSPASAAPRLHYNLWGSVVDQTQQSSAAPTPSSSSAGGGDVSPQMDFRRPSQQGLSLSLSSQQQRTVNYRSLSGEIVGNSPSSASNGISSVQSVILGSKYLKAAQELLDEVVNVGNNNKGIYNKEELGEKVKGNRDSNSSGDGGGENSAAGEKHVAELTTAQRQELQMKKSKLVSMLDEVEQRYRQYEQQMQIVISSFEQAAGYGAAKSYTALALKTISKQFRCLKDAISSQIRGTSKALGEEDHNYCLGVKVMEGGSRLRYVDHHLRQQRALQQLGMIQPNAWRPQRGLPERAVSILRAWLFEHFLHPYPKDSDKVMLAKQTGLTRSQVSNWFINARVRLWKPMVEEMYLEETKEQEHKNNYNGSDTTNNIRSSSKELGSTSNNPNNPTDQSGDIIKLDQIKIPQSNQQEIFFNHQNTTSPTEISGNSSMSTSPNINMGGGGGGSLHRSHTGGGFHLVGVGSSDKPARRTTTTSEIMLNSPSSILSVDMELKHHNHTNNNNNKFIGLIDQSHTKDGYPLMTGISTNHGDGGGGGFGAFSMEDMIGSSRFNNNVTDHQLASSTRFQGNSVSLTLGLPHNNNNNNNNNNNSNNENLSISGTPPHHQQHGFLSQNIHHLGRRLEIGTNNNNNGNNEFCVINAAPPPSHSAGPPSYETTIDIQNTKRFAAQLLPDFVT